MVFEPMNLNRGRESRPAHQETVTRLGTAYRYDNDYREVARLPSGLDVIFRTVHPEDRQMLAEGMARLSQRSRHARFLADKPSLSERELRYLTEFDGHNHIALGAARPLPGGREEGIGIARLVRLEEDPEVAEPAVTVIDEYQDCGVGTALLRRLVGAARERGVRRFRCEFLADNHRVCSIIDDLDEGAIVHREGGVVTMEFPLPSPRPDEHPRVTLKRSAMYRLLTRAAQGWLSLQCTLDRKQPPDLFLSGGNVTVALPEPGWSREQMSLAESSHGPSAAEPTGEIEE